MAYRLKPTREYEFSQLELGPAATFQLRAAEEWIRENGDRLPDTVAVWFGNRTVTLWGYGDLMLYFLVREPDEATMYLVVDRKNLPDWFVAPTGTWREKMDLRDE